MESSETQVTWAGLVRQFDRGGGYETVNKALIWFILLQYIS